ncbi:MAG TPA: DUF4340 domain-containing protein [Candidatus Limnocylindria bacterium]|nr:DUF4340 domain-containing protein [Candidatus Limnocylindria bacterium]
MRWRQVIVLWLVASGLAAQYWLVDRRRPTVPPAERPERRRLLAELPTNEVVGVRMERDGAAVALRRYGEQWTVEQPPGGQVPAGLVQAFVEALTALEEIERVPAGDADERAFGFDDGALRVYVSDAHGRELALVVGASNASGTAVYARVGDAPDPVLIGRNLEYYASLILDEVRRSSSEPSGDGPVAATGARGGRAVGAG